MSDKKFRFEEFGGDPCSNDEPSEHEIVTAGFNSDCTQCPELIYSGDQIRYDAENEGWRHMMCASRRPTKKPCRDCNMFHVGECI